MFTAIIFIQQSVKGLIAEFTYDVSPSYWQTMNGVFGLLLAFLYLWSSYTLSQARRWRFGVSFVRAVLADYGFAIMIVALVHAPDGLATAQALTNGHVRPHVLILGRCGGQDFRQKAFFLYTKLFIK